MLSNVSYFEFGKNSFLGNDTFRPKWVCLPAKTRTFVMRATIDLAEERLNISLFRKSHRQRAGKTGSKFETMLS